MLEGAILGGIVEAVFGYLIVTAEPGLKKWIGRDPAKLAFQRALAGAYTAFVHNYPGFTHFMFFDWQFLAGEAAAQELAKLLTRAGHSDPALLAQAWLAEWRKDAPFQPDLDDLVGPCADFLTWLEAEAKQQPALDPFFDSRALEQVEGMSDDVSALRGSLDRAIKNAARYDDAVKKALAQISDGQTHLSDQLRAHYSAAFAGLAELYLQPDSVYQRVDVDNFTGREWLDAELDAFLSGNDRGVFLLVGEAGVGKTAYLAHVARERGAAHFFAEQAPGEGGVVRALQSLSAQLASRYRLEPYAERDHLPQSLVGYADFFDRLIRQAAGELKAGEKLLILIDALDEAGTPAGYNVLMLPRILPEGVYLILSQHPVPIELRIEPYPHEVTLAAEGDDNLKDMRRFLEAAAGRPAIAGQLKAQGYAAAQFVETLQEKSRGVWMYLHYVLSDIARGRRAPRVLAQLPAGLVAYYAAFWQRWADQPQWDGFYAPILGALAAAREPVAVERLLRWTSVTASPYAVAQLLNGEWSGFIQKYGEGYRLYHASLRDFLRGETAEVTRSDALLVGELKQRTMEAHARIADHYREACGGDWPALGEQDGSYGLRHLAYHLAEAERWEDLHALVAEENGAAQPWAAARHGAEGSYAGYLADVGLAWEQADRQFNDGQSGALGRQVRYALIESSVHSLAGNIPAELLVQLVIEHLPGWSPAAALAYAFQIPDDLFRSRARALAALAPHLPPDLLRAALQAAAGIADDGSRAEALAPLAPHLPPDLLRAALQAAAGIADDGYRAEALAALAPHLPPDLLRAQWPQTLRLLARRERSTLLSDLKALSAWLETLGDEEESREIARAILDVGRWWP